MKLKLKILFLHTFFEQPIVHAHKEKGTTHGITIHKQNSQANPASHFSRQPKERKNK